MDLPAQFSQRRAAQFLGQSRKVVARHIERGLLETSGPYNAITRQSVELLLGRPLTIQDWDRATVAINHAGLEAA